MNNKIEFERLAEKFKFIHIDNKVEDFEKKSVFG